MARFGEKSNKKILSLVTNFFYLISRRISAFRTNLGTIRKKSEFFFTIRKKSGNFEFSNFLPNCLKRRDLTKLAVFPGMKILFYFFHGPTRCLKRQGYCVKMILLTRTSRKPLVAINQGRFVL